MFGIAARHSEPPVLDELGDLPVTHLPLPRPLLYEAWHRLRRPSFRAAFAGADVVHATGGVMPPAVAPLVATIHDLAFLSTPEFFNRRGVRFMTRGFEIARDEARIIVVPSEATAADCEAHGVESGRIRVVPWGARPVLVDDDARGRVRTRFSLPDRFLLFVGTQEPRKNLDRLVRAHRGAGVALPLVIAGPMGWGELLPGIGPGEIDDPAGPVRFLGPVPADCLQALYDLAEAVVYPSIKEGFGLPVLEAMAQGTAAVTSAGTATAEVAGDTGLLIDPLDTVDIAEALLSVVDDPEGWASRGEAAADRAARFTWEATAVALDGIYDEVAG